MQKIKIKRKIKTAMELKSLKNAKKDRFIGYIHRQRKKLIHAIHIADQNTPLSTGEWDRRWLIGDLMVESITKSFPKLEKIVNSHYDMRFTSNNENISIKSGFGMFERLKRHKKDGKYCWNKITVKNRNGAIFEDDKASDVIANDDWTKMLVIQRQSIKDFMFYSFGIVSFKTIQKKCERGATEQIFAKLKNSDYDYFYKCPHFLPEYAEEEKIEINRKFLQDDENTTNRLLRKGRLKL
jgi:hypothetical protein